MTDSAADEGGGLDMLPGGSRAAIRIRIRRLVVASAFGLALTVGAGGDFARAQQPPPASDGYGAAAERFAFDAADTDGDGLISEAELARDAAAAFSRLDADRSRTLTPDELGPHKAEWFSRVDANSDGKLTFDEVMKYKLRAFKEADKNKDGYLSFEEMRDAVAAEVGG